MVRINKIFTHWQIVLIAAITLFFCYQSFSKNIPISYYDEEWWIEDSYFYQFYSEGNFNRNIWDSVPSKNQPMLTRFMFGAWLYPEYLKAKYNDSALDYSKFLVSNGFLFASSLPQYPTFNKTSGNHNMTLQIGSSGLPNDLLKKYGEGIRNNIHIIQNVRKLNLLLLVAAVIIPTLLIRKQKGLSFALVFIFLYGLNTIVTNYGLMAQAEAPFLLLFNSSIILMYLQYLDDKKNVYLIIFSVLAGLCFSTKLNGIMLLFILIVFEVKKTFFKYKGKQIIKSLKNVAIASVISISVFTLLNPFVYPNPIRRIIEMFNYRRSVVNVQMKIFPEQAINNIGSQYLYIVNGFFNNSYVPNFDNLKFAGLFALILFILGVYFEINKAKRGNKYSDFMLTAFLVVILTTGAYLQLSWNRYLIHLVLFFIYYQIAGLCFLITKVKQRFYYSTGKTGFI